MLRLSQKQVDEFEIWWATLREPDRPSYYGLRDLVDGVYFQGLVLFIIVLNTIYIFYTTEADIQSIQDNPNEYHSTDTKKTRLYYDSCFTAVYTLELILKLIVHRSFLFFGDDWRWNLFDFSLVVFSIFDNIMTIVLLPEKVDRPNLTFLRVLRILRITRIMRMFRAIRWVQELRLMLDCVVNSAFHLVWCVFLIVMVLIMFALLLVQGLTHELAPQHADSMIGYNKSKADIQGFFDSVPHAMLSFFKATTGGEDWQDFYVFCAEAGAFYELVFLFYIAFFCIVAWNIVMSTCVEKAFKLAVPDANLIMMEKRKKDLIYSKELTTIIQSRLGEEKQRISLKVFKDLVDDPELSFWFQARDFDMKDAELFFNMLSSTNKQHEVDVHTFVLGCMRLQGAASNIDLQALHYDLRNLHMKLHVDFMHLSQELMKCLGKDSSKEYYSPRPDTIRDTRVEILV